MSAGIAVWIPFAIILGLLAIFALRNRPWLLVIVAAIAFGAVAINTLTADAPTTPPAAPQAPTVTLHAPSPPDAPITATAESDTATATATTGDDSVTVHTSVHTRTVTRHTIRPPLSTVQLGLLAFGIVAGAYALLRISLGWGRVDG